jgi:subtilase family serine protease
VAWSGSGGGRSAVFARPAYQNGVADIVGPARGIPDISMDASCTSGVEVYAMGVWSGACGTSLATPLFAGVVALAAQEAGHPLGMINPALYRMAASHDPGIVDIVHGDNGFTIPGSPKSFRIKGFSAQPGYDLVTGLGTVNAALFVPELAKAAG